MGATVALLAIQSAVALCLHKNVNIHIVTILWIYRDVRESYTQTSSHSSRLFMSSTCCHSWRAPAGARRVQQCTRPPFSP